MRDGIIKGTGNSRYLKTVSDALTRWPTYDSFMRAMVAGTFLADLYGLNSAGWQDVGTTINKSSLLSDATANAIGTAGEIDTPDKALAKLRSLVQTAQSTASGKGNCNISTGTYIGTGHRGSNSKNSITLPGIPKLVAVCGDNSLPLVLINGVNSLFSRAGGSDFLMDVSWSGYSVYWWDSKTGYSDGSAQLNYSGRKYYYVGFY